jgi:hypothetical protein
VAKLLISDNPKQIEMLAKTAAASPKYMDALRQISGALVTREAAMAGGQTGRAWQLLGGPRLGAAADQDEQKR